MRPPRLRVVSRQVDRFRAEPSSMRNAAVVIISVTLGTVVIGSIVMWLFDPRDFPDLWSALWFTLQTVTTVGYGDVTPTSPIGRIVAGLVMLVAIAFLTVVTALITSTFIEAAQRERRASDDAAERDARDLIDARFDEVARRLAAIEGALARIEKGATANANTATDPSAQERPPEAT
jgi:voltage-gated potassium channel